MDIAKKHAAFIIALIAFFSLSASAVLTDAVSAETKLKTPRLTNHASGSTSIRNTWTKVKGADGYEIFRAGKKDGNYKKVKTITNGKTLSWNNKKLKKNRNYYYQVRAYKKDGSNKVYGNFSAGQWAVPTDQPNWAYSISGKSKKTRTVKVIFTNKSRYPMVFEKQGAYLTGAKAVKRWESRPAQQWHEMKNTQLKAAGIYPAEMKKNMTIKPGKKAVLQYKTRIPARYTKSGYLASDFKHHKKKYGVLHSYKKGSRIWLY